MVKYRSRWGMQLITIAWRGAEARRAGLPKVSPYDSTSGRLKGFQRQRNAAWVDGWKEADRDLAEALLHEQERMRPSEP